MTPDREDVIPLSAFGGTSFSVRREEVAVIHLRSDNEGLVPIEVIIVPTIAAPLQNLKSLDSRNLPYIQGLKLAHPITNEDVFETDLLIGADHYC